MVALWTKDDIEEEAVDIGGTKLVSNGALWTKDDLAKDPDYVPTPDLVQEEGMSETALSPLEQRFKDMSGVRQSTPEEKLHRQETIEGVVPALGGTAGAMLGLASPLPGGAYLGAGLGTAIGRQLTQKEGERTGTRDPMTPVDALAQAGKDTLIGGAEEFAGAKFLGPAVKSLSDVAKKGADMISPFKGAVERRAAGLYKGLTSRAPIDSKVVQEGKKLKEIIPDWKPTQGNLTKDWETNRFERGAGKEIEVDQHYLQEDNLNAIDNYLTKAKGEGTLPDAIAMLKSRGVTVDKKLYDAMDSLKKNQAKYSPGIDKADVGATVQNQASVLEKEAIEKYGEAFKLETKPIIPAKGLLAKAEAIVAQGDPTEALSDIPGNIRRFIKVYGSEVEGTATHISPKDLQRMRSTLGEKIRIENAGDADKFKVMRMREFMDAIDEGFEEAAPLLSKELNAARKLYKTEVVDKFYNGTVGDILNYSKDGGRVAPESVMSKFFKGSETGTGTTPIKDFKRAFGNDPAMNKQMTDYIDSRMTREATDKTSGEITEKSLNRFLKKYDEPLTELGIKDRYTSVLKASQRAGEAKLVMKEFEKSEASKLVGTDIDSAIKKVFTEGNVGKASKDLMKIVSDNPQAKKGLQNGIIEHIQDQMGGDIKKLNALMKKFAPAYSSIFSGNAGRAKLGALRNYQDALSRMSPAEKGSFFNGETDARRRFMRDFIQGDRVAGNKVAGFLNGIRSLAQTFSDRKVTKLLQEAAIDPNKAVALKMLGTKTPKEMYSTFVELMGGAGVRITGEIIKGDSNE